MDEKTLHYYDVNAENLSQRYNSADLSNLHGLLELWLPPEGRVLEIGCGTGRDGLFMASLGCRLTAVDGSSSMVALTQKAFSKAGVKNAQALKVAFPLPPGHALFDERFDAVVSIAMIMHVPEREITLFAEQVSSLLKDKGLFICSFCSGRKNSSGEPLYVNRDPEKIKKLFADQNLKLLSQWENYDGMGRNIIWHTMVFEKISTSSCDVNHKSTVAYAD